MSELLFCACLCLVPLFAHMRLNHLHDLALCGAMSGQCHEDFFDGDTVTAASLVRTRKTKVS